MNDVLDNLQPEALWRIFGRIAATPHCSKNEAALSGYMEDLIRKAGLAAVKDAAGNRCVRVPATRGFEKSPTVVLQGHLDMVCEKNKTVPFDFIQDPIRLVRRDDWITAEGTTLGADNGIGVAAALAAALSEDLTHGPLELLLTVDEETGLTGATGLSPSLVTGRILLNLDSETADAVCIGCAGGGGVTACLPLTFEKSPESAVAFELKVTGLMGGHSGIDIHENRGNAVKLMTRVLRTLAACGAFLADFHSGNKPNAIPREASAMVTLSPSKQETLEALLADAADALQSEYPNEGGLRIIYSQTARPARVLTRACCSTVLNLLTAFPSGVLAMSRDMPNLVETSNNLASAHINGNMLFVHNTPRSSLAQSLQATVDQITSISGMAGATYSLEKPYPGWQPNTQSPILQVVETAYEEIFGKAPIRMATHAGLECGIIGKKFPGMDMISFGPDIINAHSPDEAVSITSVASFWRLLTGVLERLARGGPAAVAPGR